VLKTGEYDWFSPSLQLSRASASVFNQMQERNKLPFIPNHIMEMQRTLSEPNASSLKLSEIAKKDPLLTAEILRIANTMSREKDSSISSIEHAISYIGHTILSEIVLIAAIKSFSLNTYYYTSAVFWHEAMAVGFLAESLARRFAKHLNHNEVFIAGTLCNLGKFVGAFYLPEIIDLIHLEISSVANQSLNWTGHEKAKNLPSHGILGEIGAVIWGLPDYVRDCSQVHHSWDAIETNFLGKELSLVELVAFANQLSHLAENRLFRMDQPIYKSIVARHPKIFSDTNLLLVDYEAIKKRVELTLSKR